MMTLVEIHPDWRHQLNDGLAALAAPLGDSQRERLLGYLGLLRKWNRTYNLTAVRDPTLMVRRQLLDSLSISPWIDRGPVLDVGTGAGLPGIPLAIAHPGLLFSLIDTNGKKTRFLKQISGELGLSNVEVIKGRVEQLDRPGHYARITARAFSDMARLVTLTERLLAADGCWLAMKGTESHEEQTGLPPGLTAATVRLQVPGEPGRRHLVILQHTGDSQAAD